MRSREGVSANENLSDANGTDIRWGGIARCVRPLGLGERSGDVCVGGKQGCRRRWALTRDIDLTWYTATNRESNTTLMTGPRLVRKKKV